MISSFYSLIIKAKNKNTKSIIEVIKTFLPQIKKYSRLLDGNDTFQSLIIFLIELINKFPNREDFLHNDKIVFAYISKSLRHEYIALSKKHDKLIATEFEIVSTSALIDPHRFENKVALSDLLTVLSPYEFRILALIYYQGYSITEIATALHITRQAVNQVKVRALRKLREVCD